MDMFVIGLLSGTLLLTLIALAATQLVKPKPAVKQPPTPQSREDINKMIADVETIGSIKYRFGLVDELIKRQMELISQTDRPSASAAHSRYKNSIIKEIKSIEQEKIKIFKTILADGFDPIITVMLDGKTQQVKMSEAVLRLEQDPNFAPQPVKKTDSIKPRKNGLRLVKSSEAKNETNTSPTKVH